MWYFCKKPAALQPAERDVVECLFAAAPTLRQAYALREALTTIFATCLTKGAASERLQEWMQQERATLLRCVSEVA
jgi:LmbE family N-acetylglucosaminyl deacetylase